MQILRRFGGQNRGKGGAILAPNELVLPFGDSYVCANFGENRSRNATVRVLTDRQILRLTDANRFYILSHAICYSYGTDNKKMSYRTETALQGGSVLARVQVVDFMHKIYI